MPLSVWWTPWLLVVDGLSHECGCPQPHRILRFRVSLSLQDWTNRNSGLWHRWLRDGAAEPLESLCGSRGFAHWHAWVHRTAGGEPCRVTAGLCRGPPAGDPAAGAGRFGARLHRVFDLPGVLRYPRHLPLVRRFGGNHPLHLRGGAPGASQALPPPELVALVPQDQISGREAARHSGVWRAWYRLWRYRHQPALRFQGMLLRPP